MVKTSDNNEPNIAPFLSKCYEMVDDPSTDSVISWSQSSDSFVIWDMTGFSRDLLPKFFKHQNFSSFMRQLNIYGFRKVDTDRWEFANEGFIKDQKHLLKHIKRRKHPQGVSQKNPPPQEPVLRVAAEVDYSRLQREVETLKTDKSALMQELNKLRERLESSQNRLLVLRERVQGMENSQQQLLSFLVMVMQNPGLLVQLLQNWRVAESGKITLNEENEYENGAVEDRMIVTYHPQLQPDDNNPSPSPLPSPLSEADFPETTIEHDFSFDKVKDFFMHFDFPSSPSPLDDSFLSNEAIGSIIVPELDLAMIEQFLLSSPVREKPDETELDDCDEESADMEAEIEAALCDSDAQLQEVSRPAVGVEGLELVTEQMGFLSPGNGS